MSLMKATVSQHIPKDIWCSAVFTLNDQNELICIKDMQRKIGVKVCLIDGSHFWHAKRTYQAQNPVDLWRIFNAEKAAIGPIEGETFFQIAALSFNSITVDFFVLPKHLMEIIGETVTHVFPVSNRDESELSPLSLLKNSAVSSEEKLDDFYSHLSVSSPLALLGMKVKRNKESTTLDYKKLGIQTGVVFGAYMLCSSAYMYFESMRVESGLADNRANVNQLLMQEQNTRKRVEDYNAIVKRKQSSIKPVEFLSALSLNPEEVIINRLVINEDTISVWGETSGSSTHVLQQFIEHELVSEAAFSSPVASLAGGEERFAIQAKVGL